MNFHFGEVSLFILKVPLDVEQAFGAERLYAEHFVKSSFGWFMKDRCRPDNLNKAPPKGRGCLA